MPVVPPEYDYREWLEAPDPASLGRIAKRINNRLPKPEHLEYIRERFGFDSEFGMFRIYPNGLVQFMRKDRLFTTIMGKSMSKWRVLSMLVLGTPDGIHPHWHEIVEKRKQECPPKVTVKKKERTLKAIARQEKRWASSMSRRTSLRVGKRNLTSSSKE